MTHFGSLPPGWAGRVEALAAGDLEPVPPRPAATILLLRDRPDPLERGPEVYMQRRRSSMAFAAGMYVFPGGSVDPGDHRWPQAWAGAGPGEWAEILGCAEELAGAVVCAAVRETFEECGLLLAAPADMGSAAGAEPDGTESTRAETVLVDTSGAEWEDERAALAGHESTLADLLGRRGLVLRADLLHAWTRWVTPEFEPRRFDTWFFMAALPELGSARDVSGEADLSVWRRPLDMLADYQAGSVDMMPPTLVTLREIALRQDTADVLSAAAARVPLPEPLTARLRPRLSESDPIELIWPVEDPFGAEPFAVDEPATSAIVDTRVGRLAHRASSEP
ncbi:MAG TPA: NUDIX hydrolase [Actinocrinis sp.]|nr:NUDIX hydrolase [Actinocrinis sp.]